MRIFWLFGLLVGCSSGIQTPSDKLSVESLKPELSALQLKQFLSCFHQNFQSITRSNTSGFRSCLTRANFETLPEHSFLQTGSVASGNIDNLVAIVTDQSSKSPALLYRSVLGTVYSNYRINTIDQSLSSTFACCGGESSACEQVPVFSQMLTQWEQGVLSLSKAMDQLNQNLGLPIPKSSPNYTVNLRPRSDQTGCAPYVCLDLSEYSNRLGIAETTCSNTGNGMDMNGYAYDGSTCLLEGYRTYLDTPYYIPAAATDENLAPNVFALDDAMKFYVDPRRYSKLKILGTGVNVSGECTDDQIFQLGYASGTTTQRVLRFCDWGYSSDESVVATSCALYSNGEHDSDGWNVFEYTLDLDSSRSLSSIQMPQNGNIVIIAMTLVPVGID